MTNTLGDMAEKIGEQLLPYVKGFATFVEGIAENFGVFASNIHETSDEMKAEQIQVNMLGKALIKYNQDQFRRNFYYDELRKIAPEVVDGLDKESFALQDLKDNLDDYNDSANKAIKNQIWQEIIKHNAEEIAKTMRDSARDATHIIADFEKLNKYPQIDVDIDIADPDVSTMEAAIAMLDEFSKPYYEDDESWVKLFNRDVKAFNQELKEMAGELLYHQPRPKWDPLNPFGLDDLRDNGATYERELAALLWDFTQHLREYSMQENVMLPTMTFDLEQAQRNLDEFMLLWGLEDLDDPDKTDPPDPLSKFTEEDIEKATELFQKYTNKYGDAAGDLVNKSLEAQKDAYLSWYEENKEMLEDSNANHLAIIDGFDAKILERDTKKHQKLLEQFESFSATARSRNDEAEQEMLTAFDENSTLFEEANITRNDIVDYYSEQRKEIDANETAAVEAEADARIAAIENEQKRRRGFTDKMASDFQSWGESSKKAFQVYKGIAIATTLIDTYRAATAQWKHYSTEYPAPWGQILGAAAFTAAVAHGKAQVDQISSAQPRGYRAGGDWVTDGEELIRVGEGGRERVTITPLEDVNLEGGTQGITLNISGNVLTDTFVEENVVPSLREALRQGETIA